VWALSGLVVVVVVVVAVSCMAGVVCGVVQGCGMWSFAVWSVHGLCGSVVAHPWVHWFVVSAWGLLGLPLGWGSAGQYPHKVRGDLV